MQIFYYSIFIIYVAALAYISIYCLMQFHLLIQYKKHYARHPKTPATPAKKDADLPFVTIQLPIFNEMYVVERLIDNIVQFDYPKEKMEIHILDDSTDETVAITQAKVAEYRAQGFQIEQITRTDRTGYKAGALKAATRYAKGDFIAIFDADFLPKPDFLRATIPHFDNPKVGVVQTRWEHINRDYSLITRLQALQLNVHFTVEQQAGRFRFTSSCWAGSRKELSRTCTTGTSYW